ncbi:MAG TPA: flagellar biosynthetic protein FliO [Pirellulaceae bacterium]|nr:flagellar biosynthetic protein FliO [Pirellulaceae bacterium]
MMKISAAARKALLAFTTFAATFALSVALVRAQEEPGPWMPPEGSVAGPSSDQLLNAPPSAAGGAYAAPGGSYPAAGGAYPAPSGAFDGNPPRQLAPIYREPGGGAPVSHAAPVAVPSFPGRPEPGPTFQGNLPRTAPAPLPSGPPNAFPPAQRPAPLPPAARQDIARALDPDFDIGFDRGFAAPTGFDVEVSPEGAANTPATGGDAEAKRPLPPKPEPGEAHKSSTGQFPYAATFGSLAAVLGAFFIFVWFQKRGTKRGAGALPPEVVEPLGTVPFVSRQALHVVRFGSKILLINVTTGGSETLAEIDDPREAERILALCRRHRPDPLGRTFRDILGTPRPAATSAPAERGRGAAHA